MYVLGDREFGKVVADHLRLDFDLVEFLARVDTNDRADHLWDDDHVAEVGLDEIWLLVGLGLLLGLAELLDQTHWLALEATVEPTASAGVYDIAELLRGEVEEPFCDVSIETPTAKSSVNIAMSKHSLVKVDAAVRELAEGSLSLQLCRDPLYQPISYLPAPLRGPSTGFYPYAVLMKERLIVFGVRIPAASSAFCVIISAGL